MTTSPGLSLLFFLVFWVSYFLIIFFVGTRWYYKLRGNQPASTGTVIVNGKPVSALAAWQEKERRLKRRFVWGGLALAFIPLFIPILASLFS